MSDAVFVDTSAWFAAVVPGDANHFAAAEWFARNRRPLVTTDYVLDETLTLLRTRGEGRRAITLGTKFFAGGVAVVHYLTPQQIQAAWQVFQQFRDKNWSFTDCTSKIFIECFGCGRAIAFDEHFCQFGTVAVEP
jgi:uncharacterized protein